MGFASVGYRLQALGFSRLAAPAEPEAKSFHKPEASSPKPTYSSSVKHRVSTVLKKIGLGILAVAVLAAVTYRLFGIHVALDGSGSRPRFISRLPNYDALEADRAHQRATGAATPAAAPTPAVDTPATTTPNEPAARPRDARPEGGTPDNSPTQAARASAPLAERSAAASMAASAHEQWTDFRGPNRDGRYRGRIRTEWPQGGLPLLWKQPVGPGYASFVAAEGRAFTIEQRRAQEIVAAYDIATGRELWQQSWPGEFRESMGGDGPRATPTLHDGRLYVLGALGELRCHDARTGALIWRRNILADAGASNLNWGMAASPLVIEGNDSQNHGDDLVIVLPGGSRGRSVAAYAAASGEPRWTALDDQQAYTAPMLVTLDGVRQLLVVTATRVVGLALDGGGPLWEYPWGNQQGISVAQPLLLDGDRIFVSASYGTGAAVFEVARSGEAFVARTVWHNARMKNKFTSSLLRDGFIYGLDEAILTCLDAATGDQKWKGGRYGYGQTLLAGDYIVVLTEDGDLVLVRATPERHDEVARFSAISGKTWNHPIIVDGRLLVRNISEMAAFDIRP